MPFLPPNQQHQSTEGTELDTYNVSLYNYNLHTRGRLQASLVYPVHRTRKQKCNVKYADIAVRSLTCHTATVTDMPYRITQCYLPPDRGDIPAFTPAEAGTRLSNPRGRQVDRVGLLHTEMV